MSLLLLILLSARAGACEPVKELPEAVQVAWVSRVPVSASNATWLEVVQLGDLRGLIERSARDGTTALRGLGALGRTQKLRADYKVTVFEVARGALCRPMDGEPGTMIAGVPVCDTPEQRQGGGTKAAAYTGCGYATDLASGVRGLDVLRIRWADAVTKGFCVLPWARMIAEG